jgi:hypothetical protein
LQNNCTQGNSQSMVSKRLDSPEHTAPNKALHLTASSLRSCLAAASGSR